MKKYKLTDETCNTLHGKTLYRIEALTGFANVKAGDKGGYVQSECNLSQEGTCWLYGYAKVYGDAKVYGYAEVYGDAKVFGYAEVFGNAEVYGDAEVFGDAKVTKHSDYIVFKNWWSSGRYFTWTRSNNMWRVGCFYGTSQQLIKKAYADSNTIGKEYERVVRYVESILADETKEKTSNE